MSKHYIHQLNKLNKLYRVQSSFFLFLVEVLNIEDNYDVHT
jgi:hypothetical protein